MKSVLHFALLLSLGPSSLAAAPAAWYLWQSKLDGKLVCLQTSPGPGWAQVNGPFKNNDCRK